MTRTQAFLLGVLLALLSPIAASAADGAYLPEAGTQAASRTTEVYLLCDGDHTATNCAEFDLRAVSSNQRRPVPDYIQFAIYRQSTNCTPTVSIVGRAVPTATAGATQVDHTIQALLGTGTSSVAPGVPPSFRVYLATITADADCTDLEVIVYLTYLKS